MRERFAEGNIRSGPRPLGPCLEGHLQDVRCREGGLQDEARTSVRSLTTGRRYGTVGECGRAEARVPH